MPNDAITLAARDKNKRSVALKYMMKEGKKGKKKRDQASFMFRMKKR